MKHNLIKTDSYLLVVDESEIKGYYYDYFINKVKHSGGAEYGDTLITKNIAAHLPLNGAQVLEGVDLLPPIEDDVEILIPFPNGNEYRDGKEIGVWMKGWVEGHEEGYNKACEKYKFTEKDARQLIMYSFLKGVDRGHYSKEIEDRIIQTIQQPKLPIAFESEINNPMFALSIEPKRTTNAEGRTEWVGKYIYE